MNNLSARHALPLAAFALIFAARLAAQTCNPGELRVLVIDSQESPVYEADVSIGAADRALDGGSTQTSGLVDISRIPCGAWTVTVSKAGFEIATRAVVIGNGANQELNIILTPKMQTTSVDVTDAPPPVEQTASQNNEIRPAEVKALPTNPATVTDALPLNPGIVRSPDGELKISGSGQERSALVVNQTDTTDPATGKFGQTVPVDSIESVNVLNTPFLAQYGRFTQTVIAVQTRRGGEKWHAELNDPFPDFVIRSYHMRGIRNENPRGLLGGPLLRDRIFVSTALQYSFDRLPSRTLGYPFDSSNQQSVNSFTQFDFILSPKQILTATVHISPQRTGFVNPNYFNPQPVSPSYKQHNAVGTLIDHFGFLGGIVDTSVSIQRFDAVVGSQGPADMILTPQGNRGNYFGSQNRDARRTEWLENWSLAPLKFLGTHLIKMGSSLTHASNTGRFTYHPIDILDAAGRRLERIDFNAPSAYTRTDLEVTAYLQDHWSPFHHISFDYGGRVEHQRLASSLRIGPRAGFAWTPFSDQRTVFRAGYGLFYDHLPLNIYTFSRYPTRTITFFAPDGSPIGAPIEYVNVIGSVTGPRSFLINGQRVAGAFSPRGATLNLQLEHSFSPMLRARLVYTDNQSIGLVVIEPDQLNGVNELVLNGDGKSRYRQFEATARFVWKAGQQLNLSYTRSHVNGNLNTFDSFLGNFPGTVVRPNLNTNLPANLPNRFLLWGRVKTRVWQLDALPIVEYRNGFPYAPLDALQNFAGVPYSDATRFPNFFSADTRLIRDFKVNPKYTLRLSLTALNITNHFNALAVHDNIADPSYGIFFGNYKRRYRGDFEVVF